MEKNAKSANAETMGAVQTSETLGQTIRRSLAVPQFVLFLIVLYFYLHFASAIYNLLANCK